eukprot:10500232-Lingulodinium_polyedra.AAC.1
MGGFPPCRGRHPRVCGGGVVPGGLRPAPQVCRPGAPACVRGQRTPPGWRPWAPAARLLRAS